MAADVLFKIRGQIRGKNNYGERWVIEEQLEEFETLYQQIAIKVLLDKTYIDNYLESHILFELKRSSIDKTSEFLNKIMNGDNGTIRVAEIIGNTGSDSTNGPYVQISDEVFSDIIDLKTLKEQARKIDLANQSTHIQAALKSIINGKMYYLRDGELGERY